MDPYKHKQIQTFLDNRLVDLFVKQNPDNQWLTLNDVAQWVYQTNKTEDHHRRYVGNKLISILGALYTDEQKQSFLESGYVDIQGKSEYAFRLLPEFAGTTITYKK